MRVKSIHVALLLMIILETLLYLVFINSRPLLDEGFYLTDGWLMTKGYVPYKDFFDTHFPGIYLTASVFFKIFGASLLSGRVMMILINIVAILTIYFIGKRIFDEKTAIIASAFYTFWSPVLHGFWVLPDVFMGFFALLSLFFMHEFYFRKKPKGTLFISGLLIGFFTVFKQTGLIVLAFAVAYIFISNLKNIIKSFKEFLYLTIGFSIPIISLFSYFYLIGALDSFVYSTITYVVNYVIPINHLPFSLITVLVPLVAYSLLAPYLFYLKKHKIKKFLSSKDFLIVMFLVPTLLHAFLAVYTVAHLMISLSIVSFVSATTIIKIVKEFSWKKIWSVYFVLFLAASSLGMGAFLYEYPNRDTFDDMINVGKYVKENTNQADKIQVLPRHPYIYLFAEREPASRYFWIYYFDDHNMEQKEMLIDIEKTKPTMFVYIKKDNIDDDCTVLVNEYLYENYRESTVINYSKPLYNLDDSAHIYVPK